MKKYKSFEQILIDTSRHDANMIFCKLIEINDINTNKFECMKNLTTTELIDNVDLHTLHDIAKELQLKVELPNRTIKGSHLFIEYKWGTVVLLANVTVN